MLSCWHSSSLNSSPAITWQRPSQQHFEFPVHRRIIFPPMLLTQPKVALKRGPVGVFWPVFGGINQWQETVQTPPGFGEPCATYMENNQILLHTGTRKPCYKCRDGEAPQVWTTVQNDTILSTTHSFHFFPASTTANHCQGTELKWVKFIPFCNVHTFHGAAPSTWMATSTLRAACDSDHLVQVHHLHRLLWPQSKKLTANIQEITKLCFLKAV